MISYMSVSCMHCQSIGMKGSFKRIMFEGIKYDCGTKECADALKQQTEIQMEEDRIAREIIYQEKILENLPYAHFIKAEKQYRDTHTRELDPYKKIIHKSGRLVDGNKWIETTESLTHTDNMNADAYVLAHPIVTVDG